MTIKCLNKNLCKYWELMHNVYWVVVSVSIEEEKKPKHYGCRHTIKNLLNITISEDWWWCRINWSQCEMMKSLGKLSEWITRFRIKHQFSIKTFLMSHTRIDLGQKEKRYETDTAYSYILFAFSLFAFSFTCSSSFTNNKRFRIADE